MKGQMQSEKLVIINPNVFETKTKYIWGIIILKFLERMIISPVF